MGTGVEQVCDAAEGLAAYVEKRTPRLPEIQVEVYDPASNGVWEGVSVRVVERFELEPTGKFAHVRTLLPAPDSLP